MLIFVASRSSKTKMAKNIKNKLSKASALVVTMMIMGIILVSTLSIALVAVQERKASLGENSSNQAYTTAETGIEIVMRNILKDGNITVGQLLNCNPANGRIENSGYAVELKKSDDAKIHCITDATTNLSEIASVKSIGTIGGYQRAIEVAVASESVDNGCLVCDIPKNSKKACSLLGTKNNENICADGDGCSYSLIRIDTRYGKFFSTLNNGHIIQNSDQNEEWISGKGSAGSAAVTIGKNGGKWDGYTGYGGSSSRQEVIVPNRFFDDSPEGDSTDTSPDALFVTNIGGMFIADKLIICDE